MHDDPLPALTVGRRYGAEVVARATDGRVLLRLEGFELPARSELPLSVGTRVDVEVMKLLPEVVLRVTRKILPVS